MFFQIQMQILIITNSHNTLQLDHTATQHIRIHPNGDDSNWIMLLRNRKQTFRFISCLLSGVIRGGKHAVLEELIEMKGKDIQSRCKYIRSQYVWPVQYEFCDLPEMRSRLWHQSV